jgi:hypothetical protein
MTHAATCILVQNLALSQKCFALIVSPSLESRLLSPSATTPRTFLFYALTDRTTNYCLEFSMALRLRLALAWYLSSIYFHAPHLLQSTSHTARTYLLNHNSNSPVIVARRR